ncbi:MAG: hypothetical protein ABIH46_04160, partial [Chloroflexota bacterium]
RPGGLGYRPVVAALGSKYLSSFSKYADIFPEQLTRTFSLSNNMRESLGLTLSWARVTFAFVHGGNIL